MSGFAGDGGPPEKTGRGGGGQNDPMYGFAEKVKKKDKQGNLKEFDKRIKPWRLRAGEKNKPILLLDPMGPRYTVTVHDFTGPDGKYGSLVRCIARKDERGCPLCAALANKRTATGNTKIKSEPRWYWVLTGIDRNKYVFDSGTPNEKVYTDLRRIVFVTDGQFDDMRGLEEKETNGFRGRSFDVSRSEDSKSYKIGTQWYPTNAGNPMTDEEMLAEFKAAAARHGIPVEQFIAPVDYDTVLTAPSYEEMVKIASQVAGTATAGVTVPQGDDGCVEY